MSDFYSDMGQFVRGILAPTSQNGLGQGTLIFTRITELEKESASLKQDAERYRFVKTMPAEMLLAWRGMYGFADAAIDTAMQKD